jgi:hypothetical protein
MAIDEDNLFDCFVHLAAQQNAPFHMDFANIAALQTHKLVALHLMGLNVHI